MNLSDLLIKHAKIAVLGVFIMSPQLHTVVYGQSNDTVATLTPKCNIPIKEGDDACWIMVRNHNNCYQWNPNPETNESYTWSGTCSAGEPDGYGTEVWLYDDGTQTATGTYVDGLAQGQWTSQFDDGPVENFIYVDGEPQYDSNKFRVDGKILHYNTSASGVATQDITEFDVIGFKTLLKENPSIKTVYLTSEGGQVESAKEIADILIDYELNTHVVEVCFSACTTVFLGGEKRTMERASKMGFHRSWWEYDSLKTYYESEKEYYGWSNVWEFAAWVHDDALNDVYTDFEFLLERNVAPLFAIKTLKAEADEGWYSRRKELLDAGFLTE